MFDKKKIYYNTQRALNSYNKKVNFFLSKLSHETIQRLELEKNKNYNILEIFSKSNVFKNSLKKKKISCQIFQNFFSNKFKNENFVINGNKLSIIDAEKFDYCVSFFPSFSKEELSQTLKSIHKYLKFKGRFLFLFFSPDSCMELKNIFHDIFQMEAKSMFLPNPDILFLGNMTSQIGYKNVVVDKSNYLIINKKPKDIWNFIRDLGVSNYLESRNKNSISKINYNKLCEKIELLLTKSGKITTEVSINYLIGTKIN